jgi:arginine N-succinyltransferase
MIPPKVTHRIRAAQPKDLAQVLALRDQAGPGFTSLSVSDEAIAHRLQLSQESFAAKIDAPGAQRYMLVLEDLPSKTLVGLAGVKATIGASPPFFNFRIFRVSQSSAVAQRRFDMDVLILANEFNGCSEVGSLFVRADARAGGVGRALAQTRYMLVAAGPQRFAEMFVSELRGVVSADGHSPFWDHLGRHFFRMSFEEADRLSASTDNQFITDLMPDYPIYVDLLPKDAQAVIGECHPDGRGARKLLEWEGFRFASVVDIFDGGPLMSAPRDTIRTIREARLRTLSIASKLEAPRRALIANPDVAAFACAPVVADVLENEVRVGADVADAIGVAAGGQVLVWGGDAV